MKAKIIQIGNSQGIRLPKAVMEQLGFEGEVYLEVEGSELIVRNVIAPRTGWEAAFMKMSHEGDDVLLDGESLQSEWDEKEWTW